MKNKIIISFFLFVITGMTAQKNKGILYFKDGKTEKGLIKIIDNDILFKKRKKD